MAGGGSSGQPPPLWLILLTVGAFAGFFVAFGNAIPSVDTGSCTNLTGCLGTVFSAFGFLFNIITLGGFSTPLPSPMQPILLLLMGLGWGPIIIQAIINAVGAANI